MNFSSAKSTSRAREEQPNSSMDQSIAAPEQKNLRVYWNDKITKTFLEACIQEADSDGSDGEENENIPEASQHESQQGTQGAQFMTNLREQIALKLLTSS
ncbi:hypothetical protein ACET3Z_023467 [Daucus carota]